MFMSLNVMAAKVLEPEQELPLEFRYLLKTYNELNFSEAEKKVFLERINFIGKQLGSMEKAEVYILLKSEIYKSVLQFPPLESSNLRELPKLDFQGETYSSAFFSWLSTAIQQDLVEMKNDAAFTKLEARKDLRSGLGKDEQILVRKIQKISPWIRFYSSYTEESSQDKLKQFVLQTLEKLTHYSRTFSIYSKFDNNQTTPMALFQFKEQAEEKEKTLDDIVDKKTIVATQESKVQVKKDQWEPQEDPFDLFPKKDPNYVAPKELPKPSNDWILDL